MMSRVEKGGGGVTVASSNSGHENTLDSDEVLPSVTSVVKLEHGC